MSERKSMKKILVLLFSISLFTACFEKSGVTGRIGEQIKGTNLSVQAFYMNRGKSPKEMPTVNLRNDSDQSFAIMPVEISVWFSHSGRMDKTLNSGELAGNGQIEPHKEVILPSDVFKFDVTPADQLDKVRLSIGRGGNVEVFTIKP